MKKIFKRRITVITIMILLAAQILPYLGQWDGLSKVFASVADSKEYILGENILQDVEFNDVSSGDNSTWVSYAGSWAEAEASFSQSESGILKIDITNVGRSNDSNGWGIQLYQKNISYEEGKQYFLEFDIVSTMTKKIGVYLQDGSVTDYINSTISLTSGESQHFSVQTSALKNLTMLNLFFELGLKDDTDEEGQIYISNIKLRPIEYGSVPATAKAIDVSRNSMTITFQQLAGSDDSSATVYYDIFDSEEMANEVDDTSGLTELSMLKNAAGTLWEGKVTLSAALSSGQAIRYALTKNGAAPASADFVTYVHVPFTAADYDVDTMDRSAEGYELVWQDEFNGDKLDPTKWFLQIGTKAPGGPDDWGNQEAQYYTDSNHEVRDGKLIITAQKEDQAIGGKNYTSTRIRTMTDTDESLFSTAYGRIEARMKLPTEEGTWPAFWMLPDSQSIYGTWAASGEIDIMEARGRVPDEIGGAIHYGSVWPNNVYSSKSYYFDTDVTDISGFHLYSIEWEPGKITWFVDDVEYYSTSNWYSRGENTADNYTYGAPFDIPYHIIINLAIGGTFDSSANLENADFPASMEVDFVRVYQKTEGYNDENLVKPDTSKDGSFFENHPAGADGDYIADPDFTSLSVEPVDPVLPTNTDWQFHLNNGGAATLAFETIGDTKFSKIDFTNGGTQNYSIQLIKHLPLATGYTYEISFDAKASSARDIIVKPSGDADNGWAAYAVFTAPLTTEMTHYTYRFTMSNDSDPTARLEFCMGLNTSSVWLGNITVKQVESEIVDNTDMKKAPLGNGQQIYNGTFDQGTNRLGFWHLQDITANVQKGTNYSKSAVLTATGASPALYQTGMELLQSDQYALKFDLSSASDTSFNVMFTNNDGSVVYMQENYSYRSTEVVKQFTANFAMPYGVTDKDGKFVFNLENGTTVTVDNVSLMRTTSNNVAVDYTGVEANPIPEDSRLWNGVDINAGEQDVFTVADCISLGTATATVNYQRMILHPLALKEGVKYSLKFSYKADYASTLAFTIQEDNSWTTTFEDLALQVTTEWQDYEIEFVSTLTTGSNPLNLKFLLSGSDVTPGMFYVKDAALTAIIEEAAEDAPIGTVTADEEITQNSDLIIGVTQSNWRTSFMNAAAAKGKAVIMVEEVPLTDYVDITTLVDTANGTISIPAAYLNTLNKTYRIELALEGYNNIVVNTTVKTSSGGNTDVEPPEDPKEEPKEDPNGDSGNNGGDSDNTGGNTDSDTNKDSNGSSDNNSGSSEKTVPHQIKQGNKLVMIDGVAKEISVSFKKVSEKTAKEAEKQALLLVSPTAKVLQIVDVSLPVGFKTATITFNVPDVKSGQKVTVLHLKSDGTWETIKPDSVGDETITVTFTSLSPVAFVIDDASSVSIASVKTGDDTPLTLYMILLMGALAVYGGGICYKIKKKI